MSQHYRFEIKPLAVKRMYEGGMSIRKIAAHFGCSLRTVERRMKESSVISRSPNTSTRAREIRLRLIREIAERRRRARV